MSSLYGTTQAYNPLDSTYLALAPSCGDKIFGTNINYCDLVRWGILDGEENDPRVLDLYESQQAQKTSVFKNFAKERKDTTSGATSVLSLLNQLPELSNFREAVYRSGWNKYIDQASDLFKVTLFAPLNSAFPKLAPRKPLWNGIVGGVESDLRAIMQAHTLPFGFEQSAAYNRKLRLYTALPSFSVFMDGTGEVRENLNLYTVSNDLLTLQYPEPIKRINVGQGYYTNNGALYVIDDVLRPNL
jgi:hypothetical protein